ncbi:GNAT family N-acetyltransferase [Candidatus Nitronereus thalassa]|uniref:GNAT family N-acetyltransferase n=1 Tax=Candidatus Nitronereus thalassa TaxID=3020898 RepID=A0ABU3K922_9BACT|nr:GNAT family N-acetyltransferase [Candidatus Nitronereus thalassa]MDT7042864.1 GNAT family N-acetyltransferase [Candidatus Nitronereus thalassa]
MTIRSATSKDIEVLVSLMGLFYAESGFPLDDLWAAESFTSLLGNPERGGVWMALETDSVVGYVVLSIRHTMEHGGLGAYIDDLYVKPECRRRGAATALLNSLLAECQGRGCKSIHVEAGELNQPAWRLYAKFGLQQAADGRVLLSRRLLS